MVVVDGFLAPLPYRPFMPAVLRLGRTNDDEGIDGDDVANGGDCDDGVDDDEAALMDEPLSLPTPRWGMVRFRGPTPLAGGMI